VVLLVAGSIPVIHPKQWKVGREAECGGLLNR
jgi:hypothetical protein